MRPRVGFLGVGWIGRNRMEAMLAGGRIEAAAISDPSSECVQQALALAPDAVVASDLDDLLSLDLDGLVIATPSALHSEQSVRALQRGVAVFCQKPLGRTAAEVRQVVDAARDADRLLGVDLSYRFTNGMQRIRDLVRSGELGTVFAADLVFHNAYGPDKPWFYDPALSGGGCVMDLGVHLVDLALWTLGDTVERVESQLFVGGQPMRILESEVEDYAIATLVLTGGAVLRLACSWRLPAGRDAVISAEFYGTSGAAAMRNVDGSFYRLAVERMEGTSSAELAPAEEDWGGRAATDWAVRLSEGEGYDPAAEQLVEVAEVLDRIYRR